MFGKKTCGHLQFLTVLKGFLMSRTKKNSLFAALMAVAFAFSFFYLPTPAQLTADDCTAGVGPPQSLCEGTDSDCNACFFQAFGFRPTGSCGSKVTWSRAMSSGSDTGSTTIDSNRIACKTTVVCVASPPLRNGECNVGFFGIGAGCARANRPQNCFDCSATGATSVTRVRDFFDDGCDEE